jgi:hypothetical protein
MRKSILKYILIVLILGTTHIFSAQPIIIDHSCCDLTKIPENFIVQAKQNFRIAYGHTSHGSQIVTGMTLLQSQLYNFGTSSGQLYFRDNGIPGASDLGNPDRITWAIATRNLLKNNTNNINMIIWSWCGQANTTEQNIQIYLDSMSSLEKDFPNVKFIYMTGHLYPHGSGGCVDGNNNLRNEQIRNYCRNNGKILFDFADIESYDPDGIYFLDRCADDACNYYNSQGNLIGNWAVEWCNAHPGQCGDCSCAHSHCLNCQQKGKAFWWMMARIAGWDGVPGSTVAIPTLKGPAINSVDDDGSVKFEWNAVNNATEYNIQISEDNSFSVIIHNQWTSSLEVTVSNLELGKMFYWKVRAKTENVTGDWSSVNSFITRIATPVCEFPIDNEKIDGTDVLLQWQTVPNASEYEVQVSEQTNFNVLVDSYKGNNLRFIPSGLQLGKKYYWKVRSANSLITSYWSTASSFECLANEQNKITLNTENYDFGTTQVGSHITHPFTIYNIGTTVVEISDIRITGPGASVFLVVEDNIQASIPPNDSMQFNIKFLPDNTGDYNASVNIINSSFNNPLILNISGSAIPSTDVNDNFVNQYFDFKCSPNPANTEITLNINIKQKGLNNFDISILDNNGKEYSKIHLQDLQTWNNLIKIDLTSFPSGVYYLTIKTHGNLFALPVILVK